MSPQQVCDAEYVLERLFEVPMWLERLAWFAGGFFGVALAVTLWALPWLLR